MDTLAEKLQTIIENTLADGVADLETLPSDHVCGHVISSEFDGKDYETRRARVRDMLDKAVDSKALTSEELLRISTLLTYTPEEWSATLEI
ncbi:MAG: hypothetical protein KAY37_02445 [Phycisphaerae bacterium]|nr:hypothetical protein [Phycisphaerae bacterium]